ncbi:unnamed protein product [Auanema sp. JU1783]|nr:unnamed protein product [Auanema sp. JU1783]
MASKKKITGKKGDEDEAQNKELLEVAKFLRFNLQTSSTLMEGNEVYYFSGNKAVDFLLDSKYGNKAKSNPLFTTRNQVVNYLGRFIENQLFFRAKKLVPKKKDDKKLKDAERIKRSEETATETENEEKKVEEFDEGKESKETKKADEDKKKKKKVKLEPHPLQVSSSVFKQFSSFSFFPAFVDDKDVFVWIFDPTPFYKYVIGLLIVLGTIAGCLFPLWPMWLRQGVYYLSLVGIFLFGAIVALAVFRTILFGLIWLVTLGQHKLWVFPNLTEDCGFFESFKPFYTYEYCPRTTVETHKTEEAKKTE